MVSDPIEVLHVDDDPDIAELTATYLHRENERLDVQIATSASEGRTAVAQNGFDCIVSDYEMPRQNGLEFLRAVRETWPELPFILYTGKGSEEVASEAIAAGVTDYLQKEGGASQYEVLANRIRNAVESRRAIERAEDTEAWASTLLEYSSDYVFVVDEAGDISYISPSVTRVLGYDPEELTGTDAFDSVHPDDVETAVESFAAILDRPNEDATVEFRAEHSNGSHRWLEVRGRNLTDDSVIGGVLVNARDITERKERERELEQTHDLLEETERFADVGGWKIDADTNKVTWTENLREILGIRDHSERPLDAALDLYHEEDRPMVEEAVEAALESGTPFDFEARHVRGENDELRWIRATGVPRVQDGEVVSLRGAVKDITEYREAIRAARESEQRLNLALDAAEIGIWELDLQAEEPLVRSKQHDKIFGYDDPLEEWDLERVREHVHPDDREHFEQSFEAALRDGTWAFECRIIRADGETRWIAAEGEFYFKNDEPTCGIGVVADVTERKEREQELNFTPERDGGTRETNSEQSDE